MSNLEEIRKHWDERARQSISKTGNTMGDDNLRNLEIEALSRRLQSGRKVLDVGCGNGFSTITLAKRHGLQITGLDYSSDMIINAEKLLAETDPETRKLVKFVQADVMDHQVVAETFDVIITERCLINLKTWENQQRALLNLRSWMNSGGVLLLLEGFIDNLNQLNEVRESFGLAPIKVVWHNRFFVRSEFEDFISPYFDLVAKDNFGSTYMLITRTLLHAMRQDGESFDHNLDYLATLLPNFGDYNYQQLYVLKAK